jgi:hypothetical protein
LLTIKVVPDLAADLLRQGVVRQQGVYGGDGAGQIVAGQQVRRHGDLVGLDVGPAACPNTWPLTWRIRLTKTVCVPWTLAPRTSLPSTVCLRQC